MKLDELKNVDLRELEDFTEHLETVLSLGEEDLYEYLEYAIDTYYNTEEEGENSQIVEDFFTNETFKPIYVKMQENSEAEVDE